MTDAPVTAEDPWAWLHAQASDPGPDWADVDVTAVIQPLPGMDVERCRTAVESGSVEPYEIVVDDAVPDLDGEWLWLLPADAEPAPDALRGLLAVLAKRPEVDIIGPLLVEPRRRGPGVIIRQFGQTITNNGRIQGIVASGELFQGQLRTTECLAVDGTGMLVNGEVWRDLGGFNLRLPASHRGVEFCWRAVLAGHTVVAAPDAQVVSWAEPAEVGDSRAAGLAIVGAHLRPGRRLLGRLRLILMSLLATIGYALGKDGERATGELLGLGRWCWHRELRHSLTRTARATPATDASRAKVRTLRPHRGASLRRLVESAADRVSDWIGTFSGPAEAPSLDEMTGDDFAASGRAEPRISALVAGGVISVILALVAGRTLFGSGSLRAERLLPAPDGWLALLSSYVNPVPGGSSLAGPAWAGLAGLASFVTAGRPEWLVTLLLMGCVPLAWFAAFRLLRQLLQSASMAAIGAFCYALAPVLVGALNTGSLGVTIWAVVLPACGYSLLVWTDEPLLWRRAAMVGMWGLVLTALTPLAWLPLAVVAAVVAVRSRSAEVVPRAVLAALAPALLLIGPWRDTLLAYPGRLLTGIEPTMSGTAAPQSWEVLLGRTAGTPAPLWLSITVFASLWLVAIAGSLRRRRRGAALALAGAGAAAVLAIVLSHFLVWVPPGAWARPDTLEWQVMMVGALVLAAAIGLDGIADDLRGANLGIRHLGTLAVVGLTAVVVFLGGGWWVVGGETGMQRVAPSALPPFVRNAQVSDTPGRTFVLEIDSDQVSWSLVQDDNPRLGDAERGLVFSGDPAATELAASVATRLVTGTADDALLGDLRALGASYIWLKGGEAGHRLAISNTPGLGVGTSDGDTTTWPVPGSARAVVVSGEQRTAVGDGVTAPAGARLELAEPADSRWQVVVGGQQLQPVAGVTPGQSYDLAGASGPVGITLAAGEPVWAWVQLAALLLLALLAAPGIRRAGEEAAPRRVAIVEPAAGAGPDQAPAPRRVAGG